MDRDELSRVIAGILKMLVKATQQDRIDFDEDLAHEQIMYLIAPELEKARRFEKALQEIAKGAGPFNRDPYKHAQNCIENMKGIAADALAGKEFDEDA